MWKRIQSWLGVPSDEERAAAALAESRATFRAAVHRYPAYAPPHPGYARELTPQQAQVNLDWFLATLPRRLQTLNALLAEFGVPTRPAADTPQDRQAWVGQLMDWTRRCWPAEPYRPEHLKEEHWLHAPRVGDDAIFSITLDLATLFGEICIAVYPAWRWGLDMARGNMGSQPMITARRVVLTTAPLGAKNIREIEDCEAMVVGRYQRPNQFDYSSGPLPNDRGVRHLEDACSGRVIKFFENA